jgi:UTP--glucose-1-phosphate uridylyltransferase
LCARPAIGNNPFVVILPDDLIDGNGSGVVSQMVKAYEATRSSQLGVEQVPEQDTDKYGIVNITGDDAGNSCRVESIIEKPHPGEASSNLAVVGRYILTPRIFDLLENTPKGAGGEIQLTDAISELLQHEDVFAFRFEGKRYDCGNKLGYLQATVDYGLKHAEIGDEFHDYLKSL